MASAMVVPEWLQPPDGVETWVFFDGVCNLCDGAVNFIYAGDSKGKVRFGAIQNHRELLEKHGAWHLAENMSTVIVIQGREVYARSTAAVRVLAVMDQPWQSAAAFALVPEGARDALYNFVARNRYSVFGQKEECMAPTGDFRAPLSRV